MMSVKFPWNIVILLGSGFALAEACKVRNYTLLIRVGLLYAIAVFNYLVT